MHRKLIALTLFLALATTTTAFAQTSCAQHFLGGQAPVITNPKMQNKYKELCNSDFAVGHSGLTRTPLWSAGQFTKQGLQTKERSIRSNKFFPDPRLPAAERAELDDYARSGYDRGHMFEAAAATTQATQDETFSLANMIPQNAENNRGLHAGLEKSVRNEAMRRGTLFVITGPIFQGQTLQSLKGRVIIPTGIYKCIHDPARNEAGCYVERNLPGNGYEMASVSEVEQVIGINLFPAMPISVKKKAMQLPDPAPTR
jgi:endonuclease G